ncbi:DNA-methyltransferase [Nocardia transvalensis]|uniref:DNA-methyltransferase n=1 Tax=Nocardia transvalensis TaxID=37333 RepID=UPI001895E5F5|nr:site-specific DNA-methyltransferase [Nocardia transvalensis]MBF6328747.1 site-specific DNA-methyltransferase [Nocardia transvalensis]
MSDNASLLTGEIICGEALATMRDLPTASFDALITDPPYCSGGTSTPDRTSRTAHEKYTDSGSSARAMPDFPDQRDQRSFTLWCTFWLTEVLRLVRPGGQALVFTDWRQLPALSDALQCAGWRWRGIVVWAKTSARPQAGFRNECEYILWASHGQLPSDHRPPCLPGVYTIASPRGRQRQHITAKPVELMQHLVRTVPPGGRILDPFAGSGTTGVAAYVEGRQFLGIEATAGYAQIATERLHSNTST